MSREVQDFGMSFSIIQTRYSVLQYFRSRLSHQETFSVRGAAAFNSARLVIASTIARRYSADDRTSLIGLLSLAATAANFPASFLVRGWSCVKGLGFGGSIGVVALGP